jgi:hypothetical protein
MSHYFDRRQCYRYSISLDVRFMIRKQGEFVEGGDGKIQDVSRTGIFFESPAALPPSTVLRLVVDWPVRFQGKTHIDWIVDGVVVRNSSSGTAVNIMRQRLERRSQTKKEKLVG